MTRGHKWTDEERDIVRRDYDGTNRSAHLIAAKLSSMTGDKITLNAVKGQVQRMGLAVSKGRRWTPREVEILADMITQYAPITIARRLNRSVNSVVVKSKRLGCSRLVRDGWYTKREVCEVLGVDHRKVQRWIDAGELKASYHHGHRPQKGGASAWHIAESDLRSFIINHSFELVGRNVDLFQIVGILTRWKVEGKLKPEGRARIEETRGACYASMLWRG